MARVVPRLLRTVALSLLLYALPAPILAAWLPNGTAVCDGPGYQVSPGVLVDDDELVVLWKSYAFQSAAGEVRARRFHLDGAPIKGWPEGGLWVGDVRGHLVDGDETFACSDGSGGTIVVWTTFKGDSLRLLAQRLTRSGTIGSEWPRSGLEITSTVGGSGKLTAFAPDGLGGAIVAWQDVRRGWQNPDVYVQRILPSGAIADGWPAGGLPACSADSVQGYPDLASDGDGGAIVVWHDFRSGTASVYSTRVTASGAISSGWLPDGTPVCSDPSSSQLGPKVVSDGSGGAIVVWEDWRPPPNSILGNLFAQHIMPDGAIDPRWSPCGNRICPTSGGQSYPVVSADGSGGILVAWDDYRDGIPVADDDIYAARLTSAGVLASGWSETGVPVCTKPYAQYAGLIASDGSGGAWLSWNDDRLGGYSYDIYAEHIGADGAILGTPDGTPVCTAPGMQVAPRIAPDSHGGAVVVWYDYRFVSNPGTPEAVGDTDIYASRISDNASPLETASSELAIRVLRPNPSRGSSELVFELERDGPVSARVFDASGRIVRSLLNSLPFTAGSHRLSWDGKDDHARRVASGIYYLEVGVAGRTATRRLVIVR